jgi:UDP:flavonoid glycosyltransferase YjiC (YdhE family)
MFALFGTNPYEGHFHPLVSLARPLRAAGHEVAFASTESFRGTVEAAGFPLLPAGLEPYASSGWDERVVRRKVADLLAIARRVGRPDLVVREITDLGSQVAAEVLGIPHVTVGLGIFIEAAWWRRLTRGSLDRVRASYGLPDDPRYARLNWYMYCDPVPRWFQQFPGRRPRTHRYFRVDQDPATAGTPPAWLDGLPDRPTVYVTFGTVYNKSPLLRTVLEALAGEPVNVVCTTGADQPPETLFPEGPPANAIVESYVPQGHLLPRCSVIVTHGGYNTVMGALRHGVLPLVIPFGSDHPVNAQRCEDLGIGLRLDPSDVTHATVRKSTLDLLDAPERLRRLRRLAAGEAAVPTVEDAVAVFERLV